jgi:dolichyl-phosphate-mannose-protein mannosyltransferase
VNRPRIRAVLLVTGVWLGVILLHDPWRCLPYYWDEAGYYALAALDFCRRGLLIPESTQKLGHTPLLTAFVGTVWRVFGLSPCRARLAMMLVAAAAIAATYALGRRVAGRGVGAWAALLLAISPLFFAQSSMLHIDIGPALFVTLAVLALLPQVDQSHGTPPANGASPKRAMAAFAVTASLAILSKETAVIVLPVAWAYAWRVRRELRPAAWLALSFPLLPLGIWALYYHHATGFWTGNADYLRYNLYSTLSPVRFLLSLLRRLYQLLIAGFDWILLAGALAGVWWSRRERRAAEAKAQSMAMRGQDWIDEDLPPEEVELPRLAFRQAGLPEVPMNETGDSGGIAESGSPEGGEAVEGQPAAAVQQQERSRVFADFLFLTGGLCVAYLVFHSAVGGALLRRYLLPVFPVSYITGVAFVWRLPKKFAQGVCILAVAYFMASSFINPPYPFAFEDNLAYADFVRLHQRAAHYLQGSKGDPRILTAWPATGELTVPFLGYVDRPLRVVPVDGFTTADFDKVSLDSFDFLYLYSRKWEPVNNWLARFPFLERIQQRYFDYGSQVGSEALVARYHLTLIAHYERRGQWVKIYSR